MDDFERALEIAEKLRAEGIAATVDPRSATPPCVLGVPAGGRGDLGCGFTAEWRWVAMVPGPANADAWKALVALRDVVRSVVDVARWDFEPYSLSPEREPFPAYVLSFEEGIS